MRKAMAAVVMAIASLAIPVEDLVSAQQPGVAYLAVDLATKTTVATVRPDLLDTPIVPGSVMKIATLAAALEAGAIDERTGIPCSREVTVAGHRLVCAHPDLHRPLRPAEALAHSCNTYFATIAARLPRASLDNSLRGLGLPPSDPGRPLAAAALGVGGIKASPRRLLEMITRVAQDPSSLPWRPATLAVVREGLRGAAQYGTASALGAHGIDAMAKTGTIVTPGGLPQGVVVGVTPAVKPTVGFVLLALGAAGASAADLAADRLAPTSSSVLRVGVARPRSLDANGGSTGYDVRTLSIEDYVAGVVAGEAAPGSSPSALEALAITVRTFALANRGRHKDDGFDLCDLTHCQVLKLPSTASTRAADATRGRVLVDRGKPASVFYTASCGGYSERPSVVWSGAADPIFLPSRPDAACKGEPVWTTELSAANLVRALRAGGFKGDNLRDMRVISRTRSGRVAWLRLDGFEPNQISGEDLRTIVGRTLGWQHIKSTLFELRRTSSGFHVDGHGSGHGIGLCVTGSVNLAARGESAEAILSHYFPGLRISPPSVVRAPTRVTVVVSATERREQDGLHDFAVRESEALSSKLGVNAPASITLRFHPTVESYQRATGQPWFTSGATLNVESHFVPAAALRTRGVLERTIRHELVHVLTGPTLKGRPLWILEGAAAYYAGERADAISESMAGKASDSKCPSDRELRQPASSLALGAAYARASACFARQIASGKRWSDVN